MRELHKLTPAMVAAANKPGRVADGGGLHLQTTASGGKSWLMRYVHQGRENWMGFGGVDVGAIAESLAAARGKAEAARRAIAAGKDPLAERRAEAGARKPAHVPTFKEVAEEHIAAHTKDWRNEVHRRQWPDTLERFVYPTIGELPVAAVDVHHIIGILKPIWATKSETARRVRGRIEAVLNRAAALKHRPLGHNPAEMKLMRQLLGQGRPKSENPRPSLPYIQCPGFMAKIADREDTPGLALRLLILTCVRPTEARGALWSEFDMGARLWVLPGPRVKRLRKHTNIPHRVPLSDHTLTLLKKIRRRGESPYLFPAQHEDDRPISDTSLRAILREHDISADMACLHGFRSSFRNWAAERAAGNVPDDIAEKCLAHLDGNETQAAYKRTDLLQERRAVMQQWGDYLATDPFDFG